MVFIVLAFFALIAVLDVLLIAGCAKEEDGMKFCDSCRYELTKLSDYPCCDCGDGYDKWKEKE